MELLTGNWACT